MFWHFFPSNLFIVFFLDFNLLLCLSFFYISGVCSSFNLFLYNFLFSIKLLLLPVELSLYYITVYDWLKRMQNILFRYWLRMYRFNRCKSARESLRIPNKLTHRQNNAPFFNPRIHTHTQQVILFNVWTRAEIIIYSFIEITTL